jgi:hypothetical protein
MRKDRGLTTTSHATGFGERSAWHCPASPTAPPNFTARHSRQGRVCCRHDPCSLDIWRGNSGIVPEGRTRVTRRFIAGSWSLDIFLCVFQSPEGRTENSPGLQPWERHPQRNRPERAPEKTLITTYIYVVLMCDVPVPFPPDCARGLLHEGSAAVPAF